MSTLVSLWLLHGHNKTMPRRSQKIQFGSCFTRNNKLFAGISEFARLCAHSMSDSVPKRVRLLLYSIISARQPTVYNQLSTTNCRGVLVPSRQQCRIRTCNPTMWSIHTPPLPFGMSTKRTAYCLPLSLNTGVVPSASPSTIDNRLRAYCTFRGTRCGELTVA